MISPEETPFQTAIGTRTVTQPRFDWPTLELAPPNGLNRVVEGDSDIPNDDATLALRWHAVTQISDKVIEVSQTSQATDAAAENIQQIAKQTVIKMKELKRDMEVMLLANVVTIDGALATARQTAGFQAWLTTNVSMGVGGANPEYSEDDHGTPDAAAVPGAATPLEEDTLNDVIEMCWNAGAEPSIIMCNGTNKRRISKTFTGNSTRYKDAIDKQLVAAIDFYDSDFGDLTVVPNRFLPALDADFGPAPEPATSYSVLIIDPNYARVAYLDPVQKKPLAETGHSLRELVWCEYGLQVDNEAAHGIIRDTSNTLT
jgi:hypothetical protein